MIYLLQVESKFSFEIGSCGERCSLYIILFQNIVPLCMARCTEDDHDAYKISFRVENLSAL